MTAESDSPGVFIAEQGSLGTIAGVATAVPVFIGYTERAERAERDGPSLHLQPVQVASLADYEQSFGRGHVPVVRLTPSPLTPDTVVIGLSAFRLETEGRRELHDSLRVFYANGGQRCYVVSIGTYSDAMTAAAFENGLAAARGLAMTLLLAPDAIHLADDDYRAVVQAMLTQCRDRQDRFAILDVPPASAGRPDAVAFFRAAAATAPDDARRYGIAYYPMLITSLVDAGSVGYGAIDPADLPRLQAALLAITPGGVSSAIYRDVISRITQVGPGDPDYQQINQGLAAIPAVAALYQAMAAAIGTLPPSGAIAGVYVFNDAAHGVWEAPADIALAAVVAPAVQITDASQQDLNAPPDGLAVNAIRAFTGRGVLVWGARTLDANNPDRRYVNVRRTTVFIEQSIRIALARFTFEPNDQNTWTNVTTMIDGFLLQLWQQGGLIGTTPNAAFSVACGLGSTMTADDILQGNMTVLVQVALLRPAEFIVLSFRQAISTG